MRDDSRALEVIANLLEAHGRAYRVLHDEDRADADGDGVAARVGFAKHFVQLEPLRPWYPLDRVARTSSAACSSRRSSARRRRRDRPVASPARERVKRSLPELKGAMDFYGLNYYTRWQVRSLGSRAARRHAGRAA